MRRSSWAGFPIVAPSWWHGVVAGCAGAAVLGLGIALNLPFTTGNEQLGEPEAAL
jgi:hypothetical protein